MNPSRKSVTDAKQKTSNAILNSPYIIVTAKKGKSNILPRVIILGRFAIIRKWLHQKKSMGRASTAQGKAP
jgi:hypothetical protein